MMDPIGLAMEHYDGVGRWRDTDTGVAIDTTGQLPGGPKFDGEAQLSETLKADPRFMQCATNKVLSFALGRVPSSEDSCRITALSGDLAKKGYQVKELVMDVVRDDAFRTRRPGK